MSYCKQEGKDRVIFVTKEDHEAPSNAELVEDDPNDPYEDHGLILPNGEINWNCPCLGGMASGPCGQQFKEAFSCFHYSTEEVKGSDCVENFRSMQECMQKYPELYPHEDDDNDSAPSGGAVTAATESTSTDSVPSSFTDSAPRPQKTQLLANSTLIFSFKAVYWITAETLTLEYAEIKSDDTTGPFLSTCLHDTLMHSLIERFLLKKLLIVKFEDLYVANSEWQQMLDYACNFDDAQVRVIYTTSSIFPLSFDQFCVCWLFFASLR